MEFDQIFLDEGVWRLDPCDQVEEDEDCLLVHASNNLGYRKVFTIARDCSYCGTLLRWRSMMSRLKKELLKGL